MYRPAAAISISNCNATEQLVTSSWRENPVQCAVASICGSRYDVARALRG
jgi:hypothetical protein